MSITPEELRKISNDWSNPRLAASDVAKALCLAADEIERLTLETERLRTALIWYATEIRASEALAGK